MEERKIKKDLTGQIFGRLTVIERAEDKLVKNTRYKNGTSHVTMWKCQCQCGNMCEVDTTRLLKGTTKSCGCLRKEVTSNNFTKDLTGKIFGKLTVIKHIGNKNGRSMWLCRCECGNEIEVSSHQLMQDGKTSCGCDHNKKFIDKRNKNHYTEHGDYLEGVDYNGKSFYIDKEDYDLVKDYTWLVDDKGYVATVSFGKRISLHSLLLKTEKEVDHINRIPCDNRKSNLREATSSQNKMNRKIKTSVSGVVGVTPVSYADKWRARIYIKSNGKETYLGVFDSLEEAIVARLKAEAKYYKDFAPQKHLFKKYGIEVNE